MNGVSCARPRATSSTQRLRIRHSDLIVDAVPARLLSNRGGEDRVLDPRPPTGGEIRAPASTLAPIDKNINAE